MPDKNKCNCFLNLFVLWHHPPFGLHYDNAPVFIHCFNWIDLKLTMYQLNKKTICQTADSGQIKRMLKFIVFKILLCL